MSNTDELCAAAQQALVAMEKYPVTVNHWKAVLLPAADALRAALAQQPAAPDRWNEGFKHGQWLAKHSAPVVERADSATPVVERGAGNVSDNAAPVAHARWYCVTNYGGATLCTSRADAAEVAAEQDIAVPGHGPHRAVMLAEVRPARVPLTDEQAESLIENSDGRWHDGEFRIDGPDLMKLLRDAAQPAPALVPLKDRLLAEAADTIEQMRETMRQVVLALHEAGHAPKHEQHVADAVRAALAAPAVPPQKPLHIEALNDAWEDRDRDYVRCFHSFAAGVSVAERAHGILLAAAPTAQQEPKP